MINYREFIRFCTAGGVSALLGIILLSALTDGLKLHYIGAFAISFIIVNAAAYTSALLYTFNRSTKASRSGLARYYLVSLFSLSLNSIMMFIFVDIFGINHLIAATSLVFLNSPLNYVMHKNFSFSTRITGNAATE